MKHKSLVYAVDDQGMVLFASTIYTLEKRIQSFHKKNGIRYPFAKNITTNSTIREMITWHQRILPFPDGLKRIIG
jgi:hypothetical protein